MLDYIFTRLYRFYDKREKGGNTLFSSSIYISVLRLLLFYSIIMMIDVFSGGKISISNININHTGGSIVFILGFIILINFDYSRYKIIHKNLLDKHKNNPCNKWFKIWMVAFMILALFLSPILWKEIYKLL